MEFLNGIFSLLILVEFLPGFSTLIFTFYKMLFMNRFEFHCFAVFKTREWFSLKSEVERTLNSMEQKTPPLVKLISKNSICLWTLLLIPFHA
jgi:hypothetical protein